MIRWTHLHPCYFALLLLLAAAPLARAEHAAAVELRLSRTVQFLASDQLAGRGVGTPELEHAAAYLHQQFEQLGLEVVDQPFSYTRAAEQGPNNRAAFVRRSTAQWPKSLRLDLTINADIRPLAIGDAGNIATPLVFVGYGITAPAAKYDDYAGIDVRGKTVVVLRHEPQQANALSPFNGTDHSVHAPFRRKVKNALDHGAAAMVFCTDRVEVERSRKEAERRRNALDRQVAKERDRFAKMADPNAEDVAQHRRRLQHFTALMERLDERQREEAEGMLPFEGAGLATSAKRLPVMICSRSAIDKLLAHAGRPALATLEDSIDRELTPCSFEFEAWQLVATVDVMRKEQALKNVVATLAGAGPNAGETVVIGAHYDHLGRGRRAQSAGEIHNGADDNASGVSLLLEIAGHYAMQPIPPPRRIVFVAFSGEEQGLLGSAHYVAHPTVPLATTVAMFNFDMVGRMTDNRLVMNGTKTAAEFSHWVDDVNERHGFDLKKVPGGLGPSDHASFYAQQVPVLHFFTGMHGEYHRPGDDIELLNVRGMRRIADYARELVDKLLESPIRPTYTQTDGPSLVK